MTPLSGPLYVVVGVLLVAGATKVVSPAVTATALRQMGIPSPRLSTRLLGAAEIVAGILAVATGEPLAWAAIAMFYAAFTLFVLWALQADRRVGSCGCFGQEDTPPTTGHAAFNAAAAALSTLAIVDPVRLVGLDLSAGEASLFVVLVITGIVMSILALTALPRLISIISGEVRTPAAPEFSIHRTSPSNR